MIIYTTVASDQDLEDILQLQKRNLPASLTEVQMQKQGFVTVSHRFDDLKKMNDIEQSIIAKMDGRVIAYVLAMTRHSKNDIPVLVPMFDMFDDILYAGKPVSAYQYLVVGQVCVAEAYRGKGILDHCYQAYKNHFQHTYDLAVTEIAVKNQRSVQAHQRIGFKEIYTYTASDGVAWSIVTWDWKQ